MDVIELFKKAAAAMQTEPRYVVMDNARRAADEDPELQDLIGNFNLARMDLSNEMSSENRSEERLAELNQKVTDLYNDVMTNPKMVAYNESRKDAESLIAYIDAIINTAMNGGDPMTVEEPSAGCTGSCASCAGCH